MGLTVAKRAAPATRRKSTAKSTAVAKRPQPHGGALNAGGTPGNRGNPNAPGRPASVIRERLRGSYEQRIAVLEQTADGVAIERVKVPFAFILPHVRCPSCDGAVEAKEPASLGFLEVDGERSARIGERLAALDQMARYGMGTQKEVTVEDVRGRLAKTLEAIRAALPVADAERVVQAIRPVWA